MSKRLQSLSANILGQPVRVDFDKDADLKYESAQDVKQDVLDNLEVYDVELVNLGAASAQVSVSFVIRGSVDLEVEAWGGNAWETLDDLVTEVEYEHGDDIIDAIEREGASSFEFEVQDTDLIAAYDEDGEEVELH